MALFDLANLDLLDLILASNWSEDEKYRVLSIYMQGFSEALHDAVASELNDKDEKDMLVLMKDPEVTDEKLMKFYTDRIPHLEAKLTLLALSFKKNFIVDVYKNKLDEYKNAKNTDGLAAWEQVYKDAQVDNWNEVARLLKVIESMPTPAATP